MNKAKNYSLPEVFNATSIALTFEFYSSKSDKFIVEELSKLTAKNVLLSNIPTYKTSFGNSTLIKDYEGNKPKYSFSLHMQKYSSVITIMKEILDWITETSDCKLDTLMRVNISFDKEHLKTLRDISQIDTNKLVLKLDEKYIYERFPEQEKSSFACSVKQLMPVSNISYTQNIIKNVNYVIGKPIEDYYGINFDDIANNIIKFNYIGGEDYADKKKEIQEVLEYYILTLYQTLNEQEYSRSEINELESLTDNFMKIQEAYYDQASFFKLFPDVKVYVDMVKDEQMIKTFWATIRSKLFESVINHNMTKGEFNYDTDDSQFQLRNAKLKCFNLSNFDLVKCEISGIVKDSNLIACKVEHARIYNSKIVFNNNIKTSYLEHATIDKNNKIEKCVVENNNEMINCQIIDSVIKFAGIGRSAKIDDTTVIIDREEFSAPMAKGIDTGEIRDYKWFKEMAEFDDTQEFGNEYIKPKYIK